MSLYLFWFTLSYILNYVMKIEEAVFRRALRSHLEVAHEVSEDGGSFLLQ